MRGLLKYRSLIFLIICILIILGVNYATEPRYLPYSNDIVDINTKDDGAMLANFGDQVSDYDISKSSEDGSSYIYHITTWNNAWSNLIDNKTHTVELNPNGEKITSIYYYTAGMSDDILIYGNGNNGGVITLPRLFLGGYLLIAIILMVIGLVVLLILHKHKTLRNICEKILFIPIAYIFGTLFIKGFSTSSYSSTRDFCLILLIAIHVYFLLLSIINFYRESKHER